MDGNDRGLLGVEPVGHFDDAAGVVRKSPRADFEIGALVVDQHRRLETRPGANRFDVLGMVAEQRPGILDRRQAVVIDALLVLLARSTGGAKHEQRDRDGRLAIHSRYCFRKRSHWQLTIWVAFFAGDAAQFLPCWPTQNLLANKGNALHLICRQSLMSSMISLVGQLTVRHPPLRRINPEGDKMSSGTCY